MQICTSVKLPVREEERQENKRQINSIINVSRANGTTIVYKNETLNVNDNFDNCTLTF